MITETIAPEQAFGIVEELRAADVTKQGLEYFESRLKRLANAGWVLGIVSYSVVKHRGRRGHLLHTPRNEWRNLAHFYNTASATRIFYWDNFAITKYASVDMAKRCPKPAGTFTTFLTPTGRPL